MRLYPSDELMTLTDVIFLARRVAHDENFAVKRCEYIDQCGSRVDLISESVLDDIVAIQPPEGWQIVPVSSVYARVCSLSRYKKIVLYRADDLGALRGVYGYVEMERELASIVYNGGLNLCWERFTLAKELMHLVLPITPDGTDLDSVAMSMLETAVASRRLKFTSSTQLSDELAALIMALEILVPWALRPQLSRLIKAEATPYQIAKVFMMPLNFCEYMLTSDYLNLSARINEGVQDDAE